MPRFGTVFCRCNFSGNSTVSTVCRVLSTVCKQQLGDNPKKYPTLGSEILIILWWWFIGGFKLFVLFLFFASFSYSKFLSQHRQNSGLWWSLNLLPLSTTINRLRLLQDTKNIFGDFKTNFFFFLSLCNPSPSSQIPPVKPLVSVPLSAPQYQYYVSPPLFLSHC